MLADFTDGNLRQIVSDVAQVDEKADEKVDEKQVFW